MQELFTQLQVQLVPLLVLVLVTVWVFVCVMESLSLLVLVAVLVTVWVCEVVGELVLVVSMLTLVLGDPMPEMLTEEEGNRGIRNLSGINLLRIPLKPKVGQLTKNLKTSIFSITKFVKVYIYY